MAAVIVSIEFFCPEKGGRVQPIPPVVFRCPVFFDNVPGLSEHGYDCRLDLRSRGEVPKGVVIDNVAADFLSGDEVLRVLYVGATFKVWERGFIGAGKVVFLGE